MPPDDADGNQVTELSVTQVFKRGVEYRGSVVGVLLRYRIGLLAWLACRPCLVIVAVVNVVSWPIQTGAICKRLKRDCQKPPRLLSVHRNLDLFRHLYVFVFITDRIEVEAFLKEFVVLIPIDIILLFIDICP